MANHVTTTVEVISENPQVFQKLMDWFDGKDYKELGDTMFLYNLLYPSSDEYDRSEYTDRMGAKWAYIEEVEVDNEYFVMHTTSAWYYIEGAIEQMGSILNEIDDDVLLRFTFEDESLDPIGGGAWYKGELDFDETTYEWPDEDELSPEEYQLEMDSLYEDVYELCAEMMHNSESFLLNK